MPFTLRPFVALSVFSLALAVPLLGQDTGKFLHPALREALEQSPSAEGLVVNAWLEEFGLGNRTRERLTAEIAPGLDKASVDAQTRIIVLDHAASMRALVTDPVRIAAEAAGFETTFVGELTPIVSVRGPLTSVVAWLHTLPSVRALYLDLPGEEELDNSIGTIRADWVHGQPNGLTGSGVSVGVIDTGTVSATNPYLPPGITFFPGAGSTGAHATACAGMICSTHPTQRGVAPGISLLSAVFGGSESTLIQRGEWAYMNGANLVSISLVVGTVAGGNLNLGDRGYDYLVRTLGKMMVKSCGNQGNGGPVTSPGRGWNVIAVGNVNDGDNEEWSDDSMSTSSSGVDPSSGVPKPEVSAPGTSINSTTTSSPWIGATGSGTSYAAPHVAGTLALLIEAVPALATQPEALRAIVMATAWNDIEGSSLISDLDGVGGIVVSAAVKVAQSGRMAYGALVPGDFASTGYRDFSFDVKAGNVTRVVLSWDSNAAGPTSYDPDALDARFDLEVIGPQGGAPLATATHPAAAWRILSFLPTQSGLHTVRVVRTQFNGTSEPFGIALSQKFDIDTAEITNMANQAIGSTVAYTLRDRYHPGRAYLAGASLSGGTYDSGITLGDRVLPLVFDAVTNLALLPGNGIFSGMQGVLDSIGQAQFTVAVPSEPSIIGLQVSYVWVSIDASFQDSLANVSPRYSSTLTL